ASPSRDRSSRRMVAPSPWRAQSVSARPFRSYSPFDPVSAFERCRRAARAVLECLREASARAGHGADDHRLLPTASPAISASAAWQLGADAHGGATGGRPVSL